MKTVKIEDEYYDKIKELADASDRTVVGTVSSVLGAGLGELEQLGEAVIKSSQMIEQSNTGEEEQEQPASDNSWIWVIGAVLGIAALRRVMLRPQ